MALAVKVIVDPITYDQLQIRPRPNWYEPQTRHDFRAIARWLELEAERGYESAERTRLYAKRMRWAAAMVGLYGEMRFRDLIRLPECRDFDEDCQKVTGKTE